MRISDWSSDVCSSDLGGSDERFADRIALLLREHLKRGLLDRPEHAAGVHGLQYLPHVHAGVLVHETSLSRSVLSATYDLADVPPGLFHLPSLCFASCFLPNPFPVFPVFFFFFSLLLLF